MAQQFRNNARALLVAGISSTDTSLVVESAKADLFPVANTGANPVPAATNWFKATLQDSTGAVEIVYVRTRTAGSGIMSNVLRGQEDTTALSFLAGTVVGLRITANDVQTALDLPSQNNTFIGNNTFSGNNSHSGANSFAGSNTFSGNNSYSGANSFAGAVSGQGLINLLYPVGSVYINATNNTNPGTLFGVGTWTAFGVGRVMVGLNGSDALFDTLEESGGSKDAIVVSHGHTFSGTTSEAGVHQHNSPTGVEFPYYAGTGISASGPSGLRTDQLALTGPAGTHNHTYSGTTASTGSSGTNANLQPYITVAMWKRTA